MATKRTSKYWQGRLAQVEDALHDTSFLQCQRIQEAYLSAQRALDGQLSAWYTRYAENNKITLAEAKRQLTARELKELKWDINSYIKAGKENAIDQSWMKQLENASARYHISRLEALKLQSQMEVEKLFGNMTDDIDDHLKSIFSEGYYRSAYEIQKGFGVGKDMTALDPKRVDRILSKPWAADGKNFSERLWTNKAQLIDTLHKSMTRMCVMGSSPDKAIGEIAKAMNVSRNQAGRLVMTESAYFAEESQRECFKDLGVEEYEIVATLDSHTSDICQDMDGKHFKMSEWDVGVTAPPFHVNCRTTTCPYFNDEFSIGGSRAARDGDKGQTYLVPDNLTYPEWKDAFVEGDKTGLRGVPSNAKMESAKDAPKRTKEQLEAVANSIVPKLAEYSNRPSKWSGNIRVAEDLGEDVVGVKEWNCDISVLPTADDGTLWHELLHSCSASHYGPDAYTAHQFIEEASTEFLKQQICLERSVESFASYREEVQVLGSLADGLDLGNKLNFAKELFDVPLPERYSWLEERVYSALQKANAPVRDVDEVISYVRQLRGGPNGFK